MPVEMELQVVAKLLRQGRSLDRLSSGLTLLALGFGLALALLGSPSLYVAALVAVLVLLGLAQKYWAVRVAFDAELFALLAADAETLGARTQALDLALASLGLQPKYNASRPWPERSRGALRLLRTQALLCFAQVLLALSAPPFIAIAG